MLLVYVPKEGTAYRALLAALTILLHRAPPPHTTQTYTNTHTDTKEQHLGVYWDTVTCVTGVCVGVEATSSTAGLTNVCTLRHP